MVLSTRLIDLVFIASLICLTTVFGVSAVAKLGNPQRARDGLVAFGVPERWSQQFLALLVALELLIAVLVAYPVTRPAGTWCALGALVVFSLVMARQLWRGNRPSCACFGALSSAPISWRSIARNLVLIGLAVVVLVLPAAGAALPEQAQLPLLFALLWAAGSSGWLLLLTRQNGRLLLRIEQLEHAGRHGAGNSMLNAAPAALPGTPLPPLGLSDARGRPFDLGSLHGTPVLLLFLDATCSHCRPLLEHMRQRRTAGVSIVVVSESAELQHELPGEVAVLVDPGRATAALLGVRGTPAAILIDAAGAPAQPAVHGTKPVRGLLEQHTVGEVRHEWAPV